MTTPRRILTRWIGFFFMTFIATTFASWFAARHAERVSDDRLKSAVKESVKLNSADREKNTAEILKRLDRIEEKLSGGPKDGSALVDSFR